VWVVGFIGFGGGVLFSCGCGLLLSTSTSLGCVFCMLLSCFRFNTDLRL
jgi:hypothetical protein